MMQISSAFYTLQFINELPAVVSPVDHSLIMSVIRFFNLNLFITLS